MQALITKGAETPAGGAPSQSPVYTTGGGGISPRCGKSLVQSRPPGPSSPPSPPQSHTHPNIHVAPNLPGHSQIDRNFANSILAIPYLWSCPGCTAGRGPHSQPSATKLRPFPLPPCACLHFQPPSCAPPDQPLFCAGRLSTRLCQACAQQCPGPQAACGKRLCFVPRAGLACSPQREGEDPAMWLCSTASYAPEKSNKNREVSGSGSHCLVSTVLGERFLRVAGWAAQPPEMGKEVRKWRLSPWLSRSGPQAKSAVISYLSLSPTCHVLSATSHSALPPPCLRSEPHSLVSLFPATAQPHSRQSDLSKTGCFLSPTHIALIASASCRTTFRGLSEA